MKIIKKIFPFLVLTLVACNLSKEVDIDLPTYETQPVVECYLEPGKPFRLLITRSFPFFDQFNLDSNFIENTLYEGATVTISYNGQTDTLYNFLSFEEDPVKVFNYTGFNTVPATEGLEYTLNITMPDGTDITGTTTMLPVVPIDSIVVEWNDNEEPEARLLTYITDDLDTENFYRRMLNYSSLDSFPEQDFLVTDRSFTTETFAFGTGYELVEGDTVFNTIVHLSRPYYNYLESVQLAVAANVNPFAQPSPIKSNVSGSANPIGIFTGFSYDRDTTILMQ